MTASTSPILDETKNVICSVFFVALAETTFVTLVVDKKNKRQRPPWIAWHGEVQSHNWMANQSSQEPPSQCRGRNLSLAFAYLGTIADSFLRLPRFSSPFLAAFGFCSFLLGFLLRVWGAVHFYAHKMRVISLEPHGSRSLQVHIGIRKSSVSRRKRVLLFRGRLFIGTAHSNSS